jgi:polysaccharide export outer membrane protein
VKASAMLRAMAFLAAALFPAAACYAQSGELLGPGDTVRVTVFQNPDLTTEGRLSGRGSIRMPLIGEVSLQGLTPSAAETRIADRLREESIVVNPQVSVNLVQLRSRQVSILGQVAKPGKYPIEDLSMKLTDLLATAGGVAPGGADSITVVTTRNGGTEKLEIDLPAMFRNGNLDKNLELVTGDIVFVQRSPMFYIYGEVQRPGSYRIEPNMTVMQALALAGGVTLRGTQRALRINRYVRPGNVHVLEPAMTDLVEQDDVLFVKESLF